MNLVTAEASLHLLLLISTQSHFEFVALKLRTIGKALTSLQYLVELICIKKLVKIRMIWLVTDFVLRVSVKLNEMLVTCSSLKLMKEQKREIWLWLFDSALVSYSTLMIWSSARSLKLRFTSSCYLIGWKMMTSIDVAHHLWFCWFNFFCFYLLLFLLFFWRFFTFRSFFLLHWILLAEIFFFLIFFKKFLQKTNLIFSSFLISLTASCSFTCKRVTWKQAQVSCN